MTNERSPANTIVLPESAWRETSASASAVESAGAHITRRWGFAVFLCGTAFAVYGSLVPFNFEATSAASVWQWIVELPRGLVVSSGRTDFFSNICLFVPIGIGGMAWLMRSDRWVSAALSMVVVTISAAAVSVVIEAAQTMLPSRVASYSDVLAQIVGTLLGCISWIVLGRTVRAWLARLQFARGGTQRLELLLEGYFVLQFCLSVFPLDVTIHPVDLYHKLQRGRINLIPFVGYDWDGELVAEMLLFSFTSIPYGALATRLWMPSRTELRNVADSLALGTAMVVGIELCQLFMMTRFTDATQVVMGALGVSVGVLLMHGLWPHGIASDQSRRSWLRVPGTWFFAAMLYAFIPAAFLLWPYEFVFDADIVRREVGAMLGIPFARMMQSSTLSMSTVITRDLLLYLPLGVLWGAGIRWTRAGWRPALAVVGVLGIAGTALGIETLQTLIPQRDPDVTEVLLAVAAGGVSMSALAFTPPGSASTLPQVLGEGSHP